MTEFKSVKYKWRDALLTIYYVIIQKTLSPRKSEEYVISFINPKKGRSSRSPISPQRNVLI